MERIQAKWQLLVAALLALIAGPLPAVDRLAHANLTFHMIVQHVLLVSAGILTAMAASETFWLIAVHRTMARHPRITALLSLAIVLVWHVPNSFGMAMINDALHTAMHLSYLGVGFGFGASLPALDPFARALLLIGSESLMVMLGLGMLTGVVSYPGYPRAQSAAAGIGMMLGMQAMWLAFPVGRQVIVWCKRDLDRRRRAW